MMILWASIIVVFLLLVFVYVNYKPEPTATIGTGVGNPDAVLGSPAPVTSTVIEFDDVDPIDNSNSPYGIWIRNPAYEYASGFNYLSSQAYCKSRGGQLATLEDVQKYAPQGLSYCRAGWLDGQKHGYYTDGKSSCGTTAGWFTLPNITPDSKLGTFCIGPIPGDGDVARKVILQN